MKSIIFALALVLIGQSWAQAKTILISDIDDTIKISHVLDKTEMTKNARRTDNLFAGMNSLYRILSAENPDLEVYYVSNAPPWLMRKKHTEFLTKNGFPMTEGSLKMRPDVTDKEFKVKMISSIIDQEKPTTVIMVGDNGEHDTELYSQIEQKYSKASKMRILSYIHMVYHTQNSEDTGKPLEPKQKGFATSWDLLLQLRQEGFVSADSTQLFLNAFAQTLASEPNNLKLGSLIFPAWVNCRDYKWTAQDQDLASSAEAIAVKAKIQERCSHDEIED